MEDADRELDPFDVYVVDQDVVNAARYELCIRWSPDHHPVSDTVYFRVDPPPAEAEQAWPWMKEKDGLVVSQTPPPGDMVDAGTPVRISVGQVKVPDVGAKNVAEAVAVLKEHNLGAEVLASDYAGRAIVDMKPASVLGNMEELRDDDSSLQFEPSTPHKILAIGVAFYNEEPEEIRRILTSLAEQASQMPDNIDTHVVLVGDGYQSMNSATELYLRYLFCGAAMEFKGDEGLSEEQAKSNGKLKQWKAMMGALRKASEKGVCATFFLQPVAKDRDSGLWHREEVGISGFFAKAGHQHDKHKLILSLIFKADNRRKHNSAEWMLNAFASQISSGTFDVPKACDYVLLTDAGTLFDSYCLRTLAFYMETHPQCAGCTGRQRVMRASEQDCDDENVVSAAKFFRVVQCADYEASYAMYTAAFALVGCLPVLPGPCAFIRYSHLVSSTRVKPIVNSTVAMHLQLRAAMRADDEFTQSPLQHFREVVQTPIQETDLVLANVKIAEDRIPSYALVTHGPKNAYTTWVEGASFKFQAETQLELWAKQRRRWINGAFASYVWNLFSHPEYITRSQQPWYRRYSILMLFFCQLVNYSLACLSPAIFGAALHLALTAFDIEGAYDPYIITVTVVYATFTMSFAWVHRYWDFVKPLFYLTAVLNAVAITVTLVSLIREFVVKGAVQLSISRTIIMWSAVGVTATPYFLGVVSGNLKSVGILILYSMPYYLFLPTLVGSFSLYAIARLNDISWGNRKTTDKSGFSGQVSDGQLENLKKDLSSNAGVALLFVTLFNVILEFCVVYFRYNDWFIVGVIGALFVTTMIQAIMSCLFFIFKHLSFRTCGQIVAGRSCGEICCCGRGKRRRVEYDEI